MDTKPASKTDILAQKTREYDNLPGLILGLDGWILRSLPTELRAQFLAGYEKLLRIVFHPDRYTDEQLKASRQAYLQHVNEAVKFLTTDSISYEIAVDSVPTHKNPLVSMRNSLDIRDGIIDRLDETNSKATQSIKELRQSLEDATRRYHEGVRHSDSLRHSEWRMREAVRKSVKKYPVPIGFISTRLTARQFHPIPSDFATWLGKFTSVELGTDMAERAKHIEQMRKQKVLGEPSDLKFHKFLCDLPNGESYSLVGAMTIQHLVEWLRNRNGYPSQSAEEAKVLCDLNYFERPMKTEHDRLEFRMNTHPFIMPFMNSGMFLVVSHRTPNQDPRHRLLWIDKMDGEISIVSTLSAETRQKHQAMIDAQIQERGAKRDLKQLGNILEKNMRRQDKLQARIAARNRALDDLKCKLKTAKLKKQETPKTK